MELRTRIQKDLAQADSRMRELVLTLDEEQLAVPYVKGINPPVWELGHSAFFFEYFLLRRLYKIDPLMPGCDEMWDSFEIPHEERWREGVVPKLKPTVAYYNRVIEACQDRLNSDRPLSAEEEYLFQYVIAHQNMHVESLTWCRQTLGIPAPSFAGLWEENRSYEPTESGDLEVEGGAYFIGKPHQQSPEEKAADFCFDNERPGFEKQIAPFRISKTLVSNGEFLKFVEDGGYETPSHWTFGGKYWLRESGAKAPEYWEKRDGEWWVRRFDQWEKLRLNTPVIHLSYREAEAYCRWAGRRLPSEFEWEAAASECGTLELDDRDLDCKYCGTAPADWAAGCTGEAGCLQMIGTAWEWTANQYLPYAGFEVDMYAYMSTLQFGTHNTTKGGSWATASSLIRPTYRQAYFPNRRDVFVGFRTCPVE